MNPNIHETLDAGRVTLLFKALIQNAFDVVKVVDGNLKTIYVSPSVQKALGYDPSEIIGTNPLDFVHPDDLDRALAELADVQRDGGVGRLDAIRARHKDGSWKTVEVMLQNLLHDDAVRGFVLNYRDVSDRVQAEHQLRSLRERYELAFRNSPDSITISDLQTGEFIEVNGGFARSIGYAATEIVGKSALALGIWKDPETRREIVTRVATEGRVDEVPAEIVARNGDVRSCLVSAELIHLDGRPCMLAVTRDMTETREAEALLRETTEKLRRDHVELVRKNIALNEVLEHLESEKEQYRHELCSSVDNLIRPVLRKMHDNGRLSPREIDQLLHSLDEVTGRHIDQFKNNVSKLTPRELDILEMIRAGRSSKQIADGLGLSAQTVHKHRQSIRRKLQIDHREINLAAYLRSQQGAG